MILVGCASNKVCPPSTIEVVEKVVKVSEPIQYEARELPKLPTENVSPNATDKEKLLALDKSLSILTGELIYYRKLIFPDNKDHLKYNSK